MHQGKHQVPGTYTRNTYDTYRWSIKKKKRKIITIKLFVLFFTRTRYVSLAPEALQEETSDQKKRGKLRVRTVINYTTLRVPLNYLGMDHPIP